MPTKDYNSDEYSIFTDNSGNICYSAEGYDENTGMAVNRIYKINVSNPNNVSVETLTNKHDSVQFFAMNGNGEILYVSTPSNPTGNYTETWRFRLPSGGFSTITASIGYAWKGFDNNMYTYGYGYYGNESYMTYDDNQELVWVDNNGIVLGPASPVAKWTVQNDTAVPQLYLFDNNSGGSGFSYYSTRLLTIPNKKIQLLFECNQWDTYIAEVYNENANKGRIIDISGFRLTKIINACTSNDYYYLAGIANGRNVIMQVDPADDSHKIVMTGIDVYKFTSSKNDEIQFSGLRESDGAYVLGKITADGTASITAEDLESEVTVLVPLN